MKIKQNKFGEETYYEQGILHKDDITPFHANMISPVNVKVPLDDNGIPKGHSQQVLDQYEREIFENILKTSRENREEITKEDIMKNPHGYGRIRDGKFVSFIDEFNEEKGIETDRELGNTLKKKPLPKAEPTNFGGAMDNLINKGVK